MATTVTRKRVESALAAFEQKNDQNGSNNCINNPASPARGTHKASPVKRTNGTPSPRLKKLSLPTSGGNSSNNRNLGTIDDEERKMNRHFKASSAASCGNDSTSTAATATTTIASPQSAHSSKRKSSLKGSNVVPMISRPPLDHSSPTSRFSPTTLKKRDRTSTAVQMSQQSQRNSSVVSASSPRGNNKSSAESAATSSSTGSSNPPWLKSHATDDENIFALSPVPDKEKISSSQAHTILLVKNNSPGGTAETQSITSASEASGSVNSLRMKFASPSSTTPSGVRGRIAMVEKDSKGKLRGKSLDRSKAMREMTNDEYRRQSSSVRSKRASFPLPLTEEDDEVKPLSSSPSSILERRGSCSSSKSPKSSKDRGTSDSNSKKEADDASSCKTPSRKNRKTIKIGADQIKKLVGESSSNKESNLKRGKSPSTRSRSFPSGAVIVKESDADTVASASSSAKKKKDAPTEKTDTKASDIAIVVQPKVSRKSKTVESESSIRSTDERSKLMQKTKSSPSISSTLSPTTDRSSKFRGNKDDRSTRSSRSHAVSAEAGNSVSSTLSPAGDRSSKSRSSKDGKDDKSTRSSSRSILVSTEAGKSDSRLTPELRKRLATGSAQATSEKEEAPPAGGGPPPPPASEIVVKNDRVTPDLRRRLSARSISSMRSEEEEGSLSSKSHASRSVVKDSMTSSKRRSSSSSQGSSNIPSEIKGSAKSKVLRSSFRTKAAVNGEAGSDSALESLRETGESEHESDAITSVSKNRPASKTAPDLGGQASGSSLNFASSDSGSVRKRRSLKLTETKGEGRDFDMEAEMKAFNRFRAAPSSSSKSPDPPSSAKDEKKSPSSKKKDALSKKSTEDSPSSVTDSTTPKMSKKKAVKATTERPGLSVKQLSSRFNDAASVASTAASVSSKTSKFTSSSQREQQDDESVSTRSCVSTRSEHSRKPRKPTGSINIDKKEQSSSPAPSPWLKSRNDAYQVPYSLQKGDSTVGCGLNTSAHPALSSQQRSGVSELNENLNKSQGSIKISTSRVEAARSLFSNNKDDGPPVSPTSRVGAARAAFSKTSSPTNSPSPRVETGRSVISKSEHSSLSSTASRVDAARSIFSQNEGISSKLVKTKPDPLATKTLTKPAVATTQIFSQGTSSDDDTEAESTAKFGFQLQPPLKSPRRNWHTVDPTSPFDMVKDRISSNDSFWSSKSLSTKSLSRRRYSNPRREALVKSKMVSPLDLNVKKTEILARGISRRLSGGTDIEIPKVRRPSLGSRNALANEELEIESQNRVLDRVQKYETVWKRTNVTIDESTLDTSKPHVPGRKVVYKLETRGPGRRQVWRRTSLSDGNETDLRSKTTRRASMSNLAATKMSSKFVVEHKRILDAHRRIAVTRIQALIRGSLQRLHNKNSQGASAAQWSHLSTSSHQHKMPPPKNKRPALVRTMSSSRNTLLRADFVRAHSTLKLIHEDHEATRIQAMVRGKMQRLRYRVMYLENKLKTINAAKKSDVKKIQDSTAKAIRKLERKREKQRKREAKERADVIERAELARKLSEHLMRQNKTIKEQNDRLQYFIDHLKDVNSQYEKRIAAHLKNCVTMSMHLKKIQTKRDSLINKSERFKAQLTKMKGNLLTGLHLTNWETKHATNFERVSREIIDKMERRSNDPRLVETLIRIKAGTYNEEDDMTIIEEVTVTEEDFVEPAVSEAVIDMPEVIEEEMEEVEEGENEIHEIPDDTEVVEEMEEADETEASGDDNEEGFLLTLCTDDVSEASDISDVSDLHDSFTGKNRFCDYINEIEEDKELYEKSRALLEERYLDDDKPHSARSSNTDQTCSTEQDQTRSGVNDETKEKLLGAITDDEDDKTLVELVEDEGGKTTNGGSKSEVVHVVESDKGHNEKEDEGADDEDYDDFEYEEIVVDDDEEDDDDDDDYDDDQSSIYVARSILL
ncbi:hypothetical protein ACA910_008964 [Epithemia clementina (nom. ined.)]